MTEEIVRGRTHTPAQTHDRPTDRPVCPDRWRRRREGRGARPWLLSIKRSGGRTAEAGGSPWTLTSSLADVTLMCERERVNNLERQTEFQQARGWGGGGRGRTDRRKVRGNTGWTRSDGDQRRQVSILKRFRTIILSCPITCGRPSIISGSQEYRCDVILMLHTTKRDTFYLTSRICLRR